MFSKLINLQIFNILLKEFCFISIEKMFRLFRALSFFIHAYFIYASIFEFEVTPQTVISDTDPCMLKFDLFLK